MNVADLVSTGVGGRIRLAVIVPVTIPVAVAAGLVLAGAPGQPPDYCKFVKAIADVKTRHLVLAVAAIAILCALVAPLQVAVIRFLEGYWGEGRFAQWASELGKWRQRRRYEKLDTDATAILERTAATTAMEAARARVSRARERQRQHFPKKSDLLPTALGNALKAAEQRAGDRYYLDAVVWWPRLHAVMPKATRSAVDGARDELDLLAGLTVSFFIAALVAAGLTARNGEWWRCLPAALLVVAAFAYRATVTSAIQYGLMVAVAFDLHRFDLLAGLHLPLPPDGDAERRLYWPVEQVIRGIPGSATDRPPVPELPVLTYSHPERKAGCSAPEASVAGRIDAPACRGSDRDGEDDRDGEGG